MSEHDPVPAPAGEAGLKGVSSIREPTRTERSIARRSAETRATVPDLELSIDADADPALAVAELAGCSFTAILVRACAVALREHPRANAAYRDGQFELHSRVNVAVTVPTDEGYLAPTLLDADTRSLSELDAELARLSALAGAGELTAAALAGSTFTLTDLGPQGVHRASALISPPQAAALSAGAVRELPVVRDGSIEVGHRVTLTLAADARILFGAAAGRFLLGVVRELESGRT